MFIATRYAIGVGLYLDQRREWFNMTVVRIHSLSTLTIRRLRLTNQVLAGLFL